MTVATLATATSAENRRAVVAGTIGNVLEWYDFGVYGYLATTMSQLFFPGDDKTLSLLKALPSLASACSAHVHVRCAPARCLGRVSHHRRTAARRRSGSSLARKLLSRPDEAGRQ